MSNFLHWHTVFQSVFTILHSNHEWMRVPASPYLCQKLEWAVFLNLAILIVCSGITLPKICRWQIITWKDTQHYQSIESSSIKDLALFILKFPLRMKKWSHILTQSSLPGSEAGDFRKKVCLLLDSSEIYMCTYQSSISQFLIKSESHLDHVSHSRLGWFMLLIL